MTDSKSVFQRAFDAVIEARSRQAQRFVDRFEREQGQIRNRFTSR